MTAPSYSVSQDSSNCPFDTIQKKTTTFLWSPITRNLIKCLSVKCTFLWLCAWVCVWVCVCVREGGCPRSFPRLSFGRGENSKWGTRWGKIRRGEWEGAECKLQLRLTTLTFLHLLQYDFFYFSFSQHNEEDVCVRRLHDHHHSPRRTDERSRGAADAWDVSLRLQRFLQGLRRQWATEASRSEWFCCRGSIFNLKKHCKEMAFASFQAAQAVVGVLIATLGLISYSYFYSMTSIVVNTKTPLLFSDWSFNDLYIDVFRLIFLQLKNLFYYFLFLSSFCFRYVASVYGVRSSVLRCWTFSKYLCGKTVSSLPLKKCWKMKNPSKINPPVFVHILTDIFSPNTGKHYWNINLQQLAIFIIGLFFDNPAQIVF